MSMVASAFVVISGIYNSALIALNGNKSPTSSVRTDWKLFTVSKIPFAVVQANGSHLSLSQPIHLAQSEALLPVVTAIKTPSIQRIAPLGHNTQALHTTIKSLAQYYYKPTLIQNKYEDIDGLTLSLNNQFIALTITCSLWTTLGGMIGLIAVGTCTV